MQTLWSFRFFIRVLVSENAAGLHAQTKLGKLWQIIDPLLTAAIYYFVFGVVLGLDRGIENFPVWLITGLFVFRSTVSAWNSGASSLTRSGDLLRDQRFPSMIIPLISSLASFYQLWFKFWIIVFLATLTRQPIGLEALALPLVILMHFLITASVALILSRICFYIRDLQQLLPSVFQLLRLSSGVMIPVILFDELPKVLFELLQLNPVYLIIEFYRFCFGVETAQLGLKEIIFMVVFTWLICAVAVIYFRRNELDYGNEI